jgi:hypothetical protein
MHISGQIFCTFLSLFSRLFFLRRFSHDNSLLEKPTLLPGHTREWSQVSFPYPRLTGRWKPFSGKTHTIDKVCLYVNIFPIMTSLQEAPKNYGEQEMPGIIFQLTGLLKGMMEENGYCGYLDDKVVVMPVSNGAEPDSSLSYIYGRNNVSLTIDQITYHLSSNYHHIQKNQGQGCYDN